MRIQRSEQTTTERCHSFTSWRRMGQSGHGRDERSLGHRDGYHLIMVVARPPQIGGAGEALGTGKACLDDSTWGRHAVKCVRRQNGCKTSAIPTTWDLQGFKRELSAVSNSPVPGRRRVPRCRFDEREDTTIGQGVPVWQK